MAVAKKEKKAEGAPEWMVTYGDMVTLLLTFFVLLLSMSEMKQEDKLQTFMEAIREAFGYQGGARQIPVEEFIEPPKNAPLAEMLIIPILPEDLGESSDEGVDGVRDKVRQIREAERFCVGSPIQFAELSDAPAADEQAVISAIAAELRGFNTQIEVRGHCNPKPVDGTPFTDHTDLSYIRARRVADALVDEGIDPKRLIVVAAGVNEPIAIRAYRDFERNRNDIVEVVQLSRSVDELQGM